MKDLIEELRERNDDLCKEAADQLELLQKKYYDLARSYDAMQKELELLQKKYDELEKNYDELEKKYDELGRSYDAMQKYLLKIYDSYREHLKNQ